VAAGRGRYVFIKRVGDFPSRGRITTMADRNQGRSFPNRNDYDWDDGSHGSSKAESDPLAELARLIGQTDPFSMGRANLPLQPHAKAPTRPSYEDDYELPQHAEPPPTPPSWMQRAARQEAPPPPVEQDYSSLVHPLHRYAPTHPTAHSDYNPDPGYDQAQSDYDAVQSDYDAAQSGYEPEPSYQDAGHEHAGHQPDPSRYDDALYGSYDQNAQHFQDQNYADDGGYTYEDELEAEPEPAPKRRGGMITVAAVLALAVFGVGGAFAYRTYSGSARTGEPPVIMAPSGPSKIVPSPSDAAAAKVPDRMASADSVEKLLSREEAPLDPVPRSAGPRVVFPPLNQNANPPSNASVATGGPAVGAANGTLPNIEPHRTRTVSVRGEPSDAGVPAAAPPPPAAAKPAPPPTRGISAMPAPAQRTASAVNANANAPMSLSPQASAPPSAPAAAPDPQTRVAATKPAQTAPSSPQAAPSAASSGSYLVQVSSQRSEADAEASYRSLQGKFPSVLGSRSPLIKRADLGDKGVYYRAMVGPFGSPDEAKEFCVSFKSAGGQCIIQRN
jgi:sporulation related protein